MHIIFVRCSVNTAPTSYRIFQFSSLYTEKKLPFPAGMSLTKLSLSGNNLFMTSLFSPRESLVSDIPAGDGNIEELFFGVEQLFIFQRPNPKKTWCMEPDAGVDLTLCPLQCRLQHIYHGSTLALCQSRLSGSLDLASEYRTGKVVQLSYLSPAEL